MIPDLLQVYPDSDQIRAEAKEPDLHPGLFKIRIVRVSTMSCRDRDFRNAELIETRICRNIATPSQRSRYPTCQRLAHEQIPNLTRQFHSSIASFDLVVASAPPSACTTASMPPTSSLPTFLPIPAATFVVVSDSMPLRSNARRE